jgi:hypothetical protein
VRRRRSSNADGMAAVSHVAVRRRPSA